MRLFPKHNFFNSFMLVALTFFTKNVWAYEINDRFEITSLLEFEAEYRDPDDGTSTSDFVFATGELGFNAQINDWVSGELLFLFEENGEGEDDTFEIDTAIISIANKEKAPFFLNAGRMYVPFGIYETAFINDPLTLDLGETRETALEIGFSKNGITGSIYAFNGDTDEEYSGDNKDQIEHFGGRLGLEKEFGENFFQLGLNYISSIADSDLLSEEIGEPTINSIDKTAGLGAYLIANIGGYTFIGEYIKSDDDILGSGTNTEASAFQLELDYNFRLAGKDAVFGITYQETDEAADFNLPEERKATVLSVSIIKYTSLALEIGQETDYDGNDENYAVAQLAIEF